MTERPQKPPRSDPGKARRYIRSPRRARLVHDLTLPVEPVAAVDPEPTILGFPAEFDPTAGGGSAEPQAAPQVAPPPVAPPPVLPTGGATSVAPVAAPPVVVPPVVIPRTEWWGGVALVAAGVASAVSLGLPWWRGSGATGVRLLEQGLGILGSGLGPLGRSGLWQPVAVVLGGGLLLVLGLLLFRPARTHRVVGLLALLVTLAVAAGVVVPIADANWSTASFGPGMWLAVAVAALGLLGAVKAMETAPRLGGPPA
jgi:hypothetical protein